MVLAAAVQEGLHLIQLLRDTDNMRRYVTVTILGDNQGLSILTSDIILSVLKSVVVELSSSIVPLLKCWRIC